jgi:hypothetical protein
MEERRPFAPERVLYSLAFLLLALRFLWPGDTVYILDEAFLQIRIDEHFAAGTIPLSNSRGSSIPVPYGPGAQWIFMLLRLVSWHPVFFSVVHIALQLLGALLFISTLRRAYGQEAGAWCALLVASSPLLFFLSRHTWDNTLLIPIAAVILWLLQKLKEQSHELTIHVFLGLFTGYGVNIHLMFGPLALAVGFTLLLLNLQKRGARSAQTWLLMALFSFAALAVLAPYLVEAARIARAERPLEHATVKNHWGDGRNLWWLFQRCALHSSLYGANVSFAGVKAEFLSFTGPFWGFFFQKDLFGWFGKLAAWIGAFVVLARLCRGRVESDPLRLLAALALFFFLLVLQYLNIPTGQHHFNPIWWFVFVGIAFTVTRLRDRWKKLFLLSLACTAVVNTAYIAYATAYIHQNRGARNMETSVVVTEQLRAFRELCAWGKNNGKTEVKIFKEVHMGEPPFDFLPAHMPECQGIKLTLMEERSEADFALQYPKDSETSSALVTVQLR